MAGSDENNPGDMRQMNNVRGAGQNRRALGVINKNIIGAPSFPCAVNKKALSERTTACNKILPVPVHRPITRKFASQLAETNPQIHPEETKKSTSVSLDSADCKSINEENGDFGAPMFVQHTEAMLHEIDNGMDDEIEMQDAAEEEEEEEKHVMDIDSCDNQNPLALVDYIQELHAFYRKNECHSCVPADYMSFQQDINKRMRGILIDWLIEVHYKFELMEETLYLTVNIIDRFLAVEQIPRKKLQLVGITAMLLACKYEEVSVPVVDDLIIISDKAYTRKEVIDMEKLMVNTLQFNFSLPTLYVFMKRFLKAAQADKKLELLSFFIIELCIVEYEMLQYPLSQLAASAVYTAQCTLNGFKEWNKTCESHTGYPEEQLLDCSRLMVSFHQKAGTGKLTGVHRKYSTSRFGYAAKCKPADFLLMS